MNWEQIEKWLPIVGYEGLYEVSDYGRIRSVARVARYGRLRRFSRTHDDYWKVQLSAGGLNRHFFVHELVSVAFLGPRPEAAQIDHVDGDRGNNRLSNLCYVTQKENLRAAVLRRGEWRKYYPHRGNCKRKLSDAQVLEVRRLLTEGMSQAKIAQEFGVSSPNIWQIANNRGRWAPKMQ
jgi:hypothetical protein